MSIRPVGDGAVPLAEVEIDASGAPDDADKEGDANEEVSDQAIREFQSTFDAVKGKKLAVNVVLLRGLQRTKQNIVARELRYLAEADNLDEVKDVLLEAWESLQQLEIFDAIDIVIDQGAQLPDGTNTCNVVLNCIEKNRLFLHVGTYVQGSEGQIEGSLGLKNMLGVAETATLSGLYGSASSNEFSVALGKPRLHGLPIRTELEFLQQFSNFQRFSSFTERLRGGILSVGSESGRHRLAYELAWRTLTDSSHKGSPAIKGQLGSNLKSALRYTFQHSTVDDALFPLTGLSFRSTSEIGGLWPGQNVPRYGRQHLQATWLAPLAESVALALTGEVGLLLPLAARPSTSKATCITDRFYLGGISNGLQGFSFKGAGPADRRRVDTDFSGEQSGRVTDALGGDLFASVVAALRFQLPFERMRDLGMYGQIFANAANAVLVGGTGRGAHTSLQEFTSRPRFTVGAGIVWPTPVGQLEVNLCRVLKAQDHDRWRNGIHIGFGPRS